MRLLRSGVMLLAFFGLVLAGCKSSEQVAAEKAQVEEEQNKLKGKWRLAEQTGAASDPDEKEDDSKKDMAQTGEIYSIDKDMLEIKRGNNPTYFKLTLYPSKDPKQVDLLLAEANGKAIQRTVMVRTGGKKKNVEWKEKKRDDRRLGIYKLEGDTLTVCFAYAEKSRPDSFSAPVETGRTLWTLKRIKGPDDEKKDPKAKKPEGEQKDPKAKKPEGEKKDPKDKPDGKE